MAIKQYLLEKLLLHLARGRFSSAIPDFITCSFFITVWISPDVSSKESLLDLRTIYFMELIIVMFDSIYISILTQKDSRFNKFKNNFAITLLFLGWGLMFSAGAQAWWPMIIMGWLTFSRFGNVLLNPHLTKGELQREGEYTTACSIIAFLFFIGMILLPIWVLVDIEITYHGNTAYRELTDQELAIWGVFYFFIHAILKLYDGYHHVYVLYKKTIQLLTITFGVFLLIILIAAGVVGLCLTIWALLTGNW